MDKTWISAALGCLASLDMCSFAFGAASIAKLQSPFPESATVTSISPDGSMAVGYIGRSPGPVAMKWNAAGGATNLGFANWITAETVSNAGGTIAGWDQSVDSNYRDAYRWTSGTGKVSLGGIAGLQVDARYDIPHDITPDGSVIVGEGQTPVINGKRAFRWTTATGAVSLGIPSGYLTTAASGVSADGNVIVGLAIDSLGVGQAFRWTPGGGMQTLPAAPGGAQTNALGVSGDGLTTVGFLGGGPAGTNGFRWTQNGGYQLLPDYDLDGEFVWPRAVNSDGSVIVGEDTPGSQATAVVWINGQEHRVIDLLNAAGANTTGWILGDAVDVSADGSTVVGTGSFNGGSTSYIAVLPEPGAGLLWVACFGVRFSLPKRRPD